MKPDKKLIAEKKLKSKNDPSGMCLVLYTTIGGKFMPGDQHGNIYHNSL